MLVYRCKAEAEHGPMPSNREQGNTAVSDRISGRFLISVILL